MEIKQMRVHGADIRWPEEVFLDEEEGLVYSKATDSAWRHQNLYRRPDGTFYIHEWHIPLGTEEVRRVTAAEALAWLRRNGYYPEREDGCLPRNNFN